jgi:predicted ATPase
MRPDLPTGTVTFLFTDVEGSTKLLHEIGDDAYSEILSEHHRLCREAWEAHAGAEVDTAGDAFLVAFSRPSDALAAAEAAQEALASGPLAVRMGLHTGEVLLADTGYVGMEIHRAARIAAAGHGGQVLVSSSTAALTGTAGLRDLGEHRFKDLSAPERVYQLGEGDFPKLKSLYQTNLPVPATPFVGRERELAEVTSLLLRPDVRLLTLTGPGGTGKTRLAAQAAGIAADDYPDGVFWVPLAPVRDPTLVLPTVAQTLEAKGELEEHIGGRRMLLLLDNFEQVVDASPAIAHVLSSCPNLRLLVTSRERLAIAGEQEFPVPTLATADAVDLFTQRARSLDPAFSSNGNLPKLCERLDNLPLALELAAARTKLFTLEQLFERLTERLDILKGGRDVDPRQRTLGATIQWSYDLLAPDEQTLFARLGVFAGGCTLDAAEEVCEADPEMLASLLDKSLLRRRTAEGGPRFWMLEAIREFAEERLERSGEAETLRQKHVDWLVAETARMMDDDWDANALLTFSRELADFRAAARWLMERRSGPDLMRLARNVLGYFVVRDLPEGEALFRAADELGPTETEAHAWVLIGLAYLAELLRDDVPAAEGYARRSLDTSQRLGFDAAAARALTELAFLASGQERLDEAQVLYERAASLFDRIGHESGLMDVRTGLADLALTRGDFPAAVDHSQAVLPLLDSTFHVSTKLTVLSNLAFAHTAGGNAVAAIDAVREALEILEGIGPTRDLRNTLEVAASLTAPHDICRAARLLGASESLEPIFGTLSPFEGSVHEQTVATLEGAPRGEWEQCWRSGGELDPDEAISVGLDTCEWLSERLGH